MVIAVGGWRCAQIRYPPDDLVTDEDRYPACAVHAGYFNCHACAAGGSIIDLGALLYGIEPRGAGFHRIRERLLAELGLSDFDKAAV